VDQSTTGEDAIRKMAEEGVRRLLVTDKGDIVGIFTTSDVTKLASMNQNP
jgi:CBS domain-containing protein